MRIALAIILLASVAYAEPPRDYTSSQHLLQTTTWPQSCQRFSIRILSDGDNIFSRAVSGVCPHLYIDRHTAEGELPLWTFGDVKSELRRIGRDVAISWLETKLNTHLHSGWRYTANHLSTLSQGIVELGDLPHIKPKAHLGHKGVAISFEINF